MKELAKWAWIIVLGILTMGGYIFIPFVVGIIAAILILWLKPEWLDKL